MQKRDKDETGHNAPTGKVNLEAGIQPVARVEFTSSSHGFG